MTLQQVDAQFVARLRTAFAAQLPDYLPNQRWFGSKAKRIHSVRLADCIPVRLAHSLALIAIASIAFTQGPSETYVVPLIGPSADRSQPADSVVVRLPVSQPASELPLFDALDDSEFLAAIFSALANSKSFTGEIGSLRANPELPLNEGTAESTVPLTPRRLKAEQSNTSVIYGDRYILKFFRHLEQGVHPDWEIGRFLTTIAHFPNVPPHCGALTYVSPEPEGPQGSKVMTLGILQGFIPNRGDAWRSTVESLAELFTAPNHLIGELASASNGLSASKATSNYRAAGAAVSLGRQLELMGLLGKRTAELHLALASSSDEPAFAPERFTPAVREEIDSAFHDLAVRNFETLRLKLSELPKSVAELATQVLELEDDALLTLHSIGERDITKLIRTRIHGDYHLGQVLFTGSDYFIIDFEGEPARPLSERRNKRSPLQDVAGMLRSFHYAARSASLAAKKSLAQSLQSGGTSEAQIDSLAVQWQALASRVFLHGYRSTAGDAKFLPENSADFEALLKVYLLEKAIYELGYELNNRPAWLGIPLEGIREILATKA